MSIKNKVALVTASANGIGKCIAMRFAREGAKLVICDNNNAALQETKKEIKAMGVEVLAVQYDGSKPKDIEKLFQKLIEKFGTIDILVNNAGIAGPTKPIVEVELEEWDTALAINLRGQFQCIKLAAPHMMKQKSGKIINISSQSGKKALPNRSPYCASKMGIIGLTRCAAGELGTYNINVNAICPGPVSGPRIDAVFANLAKTQNISVKKVMDQFLEPAFIKSLVPPEAIAEAALFLADHEKSALVTGQDINVNGGTITY